MAGAVMGGRRRAPGLEWDWCGVGLPAPCSEPRPQLYLAFTASCRNRSQMLKRPGKLGALSPPVPWG